MKKLISLFLISILLCSFSASTIYAQKTEEKSVGAQSGTTGDCTWTYDSSTKTLTISGNGDMEDYYGSSDIPWCNYSDSIEIIKINSGVTSIGIGAFEYCINLTSVTIPSSVTSLGGWAFEFCSSLTSVTIPNSVTSIGDCAFYNCDSLKSVKIGDSVISIGEYAFNCCSMLENITIPNSVTSIGGWAFEYCISLASVTIGDSVTSIGEYAFRYCESLTNISVDSDNKYFSSLDGNLYNKNKTKIIQYATGKTDASFTIPSSVTSIGDCAFYNCDSLKSVKIGDSVISIGEYAFEECTSLTSVTIGDSVTSIGSCAFYDCSSLTSVKIPNSVTSIGSYVFSSCTRLTNISVDSNNEYYLSLNGNLYNKNKTKLIQYAIGKTATSFTIPSSVKSIGDTAFGRCTNIKSIKILNGVTSIGTGAFMWCTALTSVTIPNSVKSIGDSAFYYCEKLSNLTVPNSVTSIGYEAFYGCNKLKGLYAQTISAKSFTKTYGAKAFSLGAKAKTKLSYKSSDTKVATVSSAGKVTIKGVGKVTITISAKYTSKYKAATKKITVTVKPKAITSFVWSGTNSKISMKWNKISKASGYQVFVSYNKNFKNSKTATVSKNSCKITNKQHKSFYVRIRAFTKYKNVKYYSNWKVISVKFL